jgi:hypothetical protein
MNFFINQFSTAKYHFLQLRYKYFPENFFSIYILGSSLRIRQKIPCHRFKFHKERRHFINFHQHVLEIKGLCSS